MKTRPRMQGPEAYDVRTTDVDQAEDQSWWGRQLQVAHQK